MNPRQLLIIDDEKAICASLRYTFEDQFRVFTCTEPQEGLRILQQDVIDIVLLDLRLGTQSGLDWIEQILALQPDLKIIMMTAYGTVESSVEAMKKGAYAYIEKPIYMDELKLLMKKCLELRYLSQRIDEMKKELQEKYHYQGIIGNSKTIQNLYTVIEKVKDIHSTVLIQGESGTGKELVAKTIHYSGERSNGRFVDINCAAIPHDLLESELFGYTKGAFTGAHKDKAGKFVLANGGTLFLDEIGEMPASLQSKLLRTLQEKEVVPLGSTSAIQIDTRIIAATNRDLKKEVEAGRFREDLFFRLNVIPMHIPPLKERKDDIPLLVKHFISLNNQAMKKQIEDTAQIAMEVLMNYDYPGNVRELANIIERAVALCEGVKINISDLPQELMKGAFDKTIATMRMKQDPDQICFSFGQSLKDVEKNMILFTLGKTKGNRKQAIEILGISERGLRDKLRKIKEEKR